MIKDLAAVMKHIIEFDPFEDKDELHAAINGMKYKLIIDDMYCWIRQMQKYEDKNTVEVDEIREKLNSLKEMYFHND